MKKLYEELTIETWKEIANKVQLLNLESYKAEAFLKNLILLRKYLYDLGICIDSNIDKPCARNEIGPASLLRTIYDTKEAIPNKKAIFYENIYALDELGVQSITFNPIKRSFVLTNDIFTLEGNPKKMRKFYTNGEFTLTSDYSTHTMLYSMDITNASYLLETYLTKTNNDINLIMAKATLCSFDAINFLPSKEEIMAFAYPKKTVIKQETLEWDQPIKVKESFELFDKSKSHFAKRLVKAQENYYQSE